MAKEAGAAKDNRVRPERRGRWRTAWDGGGGESFRRDVMAKPLDGKCPFRLVHPGNVAAMEGGDAVLKALRYGVFILAEAEKGAAMGDEIVARLAAQDAGKAPRIEESVQRFRLLRAFLAAEAVAHQIRLENA